VKGQCMYLESREVILQDVEAVFVFTFFFSE
jgi:hypothetical protein